MANFELQLWATHDSIEQLHDAATQVRREYRYEYKHE